MWTREGRCMFEVHITKSCVRYWVTDGDNFLWARKPMGGQDIRQGALFFALNFKTSQ